MTDREQLIAREVEFLKGIQTIDDLKASVDGYVSAAKTAFSSGIEEAREFAGKAESMTSEERQHVIAKFSDDDYMLPPDFVAEMERIDEIPGATEITEPIEQDFESFMEPIGEEFTAIFGPYMQAEMEGLVGGLVDGLGDIVGDMFGGEDDDEESEADDDYEKAPEESQELNDLRYVESKEELEECKESVIEDILSDIESCVDALEQSNDEDSENDESSIRYLKIDSDRLTALNNELPYIFKKLAEIPGCEEAAKQAEDEIMAAIGPKLNEVIEDFRNRLEGK